MKKKYICKGSYWDNSKRLAQIKSYLGQGRTLASIGKTFKTTRQNIWNICRRHKINSSEFIRLRIDREKVKRKKIYYRRNGFYLEDMLNAKTERQRQKYKKFKILRKSLRQRNAQLNVEYSDFDFSDYCPVLGLRLSYVNKGVRKDNSMSVDRLNNKKGYTRGNIAVMSWRANRLKSDGTAEEHRKIALFMEKKLKGHLRPKKAAFARPKSGGK